MVALNPLYQRNMGQRTGLSFSDTKIVNLAYCNDVCRSQLPRACQYGGYQDPNDCSKCRCPEGFSGTYCEAVAAPVNAQCGGVIQVTSNSQSITSPGYGSPKYYENNVQCNWWLKAPQNHVINLQFVDEFGMFCSNEACYHWLEVKYKHDLGKDGARFCCYQRPTASITSESNEMMLVFKSNFSVAFGTSRRGFKVVVNAVPNGNQPPTTTPTTTSSSSSTTVKTTPSSTSSSTTVKTTPSSTSSTSSTTSTTTSSSTSRQTSTTRQTPIEKKCEKLDLTFVIDSSGSLGLDNWKRILQFIVNVLSAVIISKDGVRVAAVSFGNDATLHFNLNDYSDHEQLRSAILNIPWKNQWTNTAAGLRLARTAVYEAAANRRDGGRNIIVLITDGASTVDTASTIPEANFARERDIEIYAVGVGDELNGNELVSITGHETNVLYVRQFGDMIKYRSDVPQELWTKICKISSIEPSEKTLSWECSFDGLDPLCGMTQDTNDQFDWTVNSGRTPSDVTGPDAAFDGNNYIYIEASFPRQRNDVARLYFPKFDYTGNVCIRFAYHMYGFHINTLQLEEISGNSVSVVWLRSRDQGNRWYEAAISAHMQENAKMSFAGIRGGEFSGDIALDKITVKSGTC